MTVKVNDFFCGAGGMGLGFKIAGFEIAGAWDFDKYAVESYKANIGDHVQQADISEMTAADVPLADVWTFGFPCQDLSNAGKQAGMKLKCTDCSEEFKVEVGEPFDTCLKCGGQKLKAASRSGLFFEVMRLLDETALENPDNLPKILLAENVKGLKKFLPVLKAEYNKRGYRMSFSLYNSKYWGVPQNRERYFVVGVREDMRKAFQFPRQQTDYIPKLSGVLEQEVEEKYYMTAEKTSNIIEAAGEVLKVRQATIKGYDEAGAGDSINISHPNSKTRRGRVGKQVAQTLLTGTEQLVVEPTQSEIQSVFTDKTGVAYCSDANYFKGTAPGDIGKSRRTQVVEEDGARFKVRRLTPREYARLQGFPDSYLQVVSNNQFYKQMGNAVTVNVSNAIAEQIKLYLKNTKEPVR